MSSVSVSRIREEEIPACAQIMAGNSLWQHYDVTYESALARFQNGYAEQATIFIAHEGEEVCGFCWVAEKGAFNRSAYIMLIGVDPLRQSRGIGKILLEETEKYLATKSVDVFLTVSDFNIGAQKFYSGMGYKTVGEIPDYVKPGITEIIMRKVLR
ncbi:MAG TPA: GNAT family N-acetyltransferase [Flexilinea sp.]|jgi:ribosomal protein S18 acetylase RimI-like enzyme|nr:GNAT family N-acetyltransferase [Flexilinea sp.]HOG22506.1 GNAT family N-acetyltransferase [Flexilinea sp.]HOG61228.1 GNAT family N-acetyltransferase [Flexilinea sp.]HOR55425.1 GNAT family N-acetyltransferase [Flexilinea sp.]HOU20444.1 GNAT family N-acetyltransferase [Flexilinea sp.]